MFPFKQFTDAAKRALALAQEEAEQAHHSYMGTEHLLLGVLRTEGVGGTILTNLGVDLGNVRRTIGSVLGRNESIIIQRIIPTSRVKTVIENSFREAKLMGDSFVGTEHLVLGLLIEGGGIAAHVIQDVGVTLTAVREGIAGERSAGRWEAPSGPAAPSGPRPDVVRRAIIGGLFTEADLLTDLASGEGEVAKLLHDHGLTAETIREALSPDLRDKAE